MKERKGNGKEDVYIDSSKQDSMRSENISKNAVSGSKTVNRKI